MAGPLTKTNMLCFHVVSICVFLQCVVAVRLLPYIKTSEHHSWEFLLGYSDHIHRKSWQHSSKRYHQRGRGKGGGWGNRRENILRGRGGEKERERERKGKKEERRHSLCRLSSSAAIYPVPSERSDCFCQSGKWSEALFCTPAPLHPCIPAAKPTCAAVLLYSL